MIILSFKKIPFNTRQTYVVEIRKFICLIFEFTSCVCEFTCWVSENTSRVCDLPVNWYWKGEREPLIPVGINWIDRFW